MPCTASGAGFSTCSSIQTCLWHRGSCGSDLAGRSDGGATPREHDRFGGCRARGPRPDRWTSSAWCRDRIASVRAIASGTWWPCDDELSPEDVEILCRKTRITRRRWILAGVLLGGMAAGLAHLASRRDDFDECG